ncbi:MAG: hypothetical protein RLZZ262_2342 [Bacteroidota bacterium]|jgi:hypothetical protein
MATKDDTLQILSLKLRWMNNQAPPHGLFPFGVAIFRWPNNAKDEMRRKAEQAFNEIRFILEEN